MYYDAVTNRHGLPFDPFKAIVAPRPIGWISSLDARGRINLAPYSFFNAFSNRPNIVGFSTQGRKDSIANIEETGEFVCNLATMALMKEMNSTSASLPHGEDEMARAGLTAVPGVSVKVPRVGESPAALECVYLQTVDLKDKDGRAANAWLVLGQVTGVYIDDAIITNGMVDITRARPVSRLGYQDYAVIDEVFQLVRPGS
ncbi:MAG: flavin reductase family protein [Flavobacteriaceae bacterium]